MSVIPIVTEPVFSAGETSWPAADVSGAAAILMQADPHETPARIKCRLEQSADDIGPPGVDPIAGHGRINFGRAVVDCCKVSD